MHSRGVRLSVLEPVNNRGPWGELKRFIEQYGSDLFTQRFMNHGNLRGILHQGVDAWLNSLGEDHDEEDHFRLLDDLDSRVPRDEAVRWLTVAMEAVVENYAEYIDYNSTTTQSDRGDMLYTLLDYLRLRASYDRVAWNLLPVVLAHEVLVRGGHDEAADVWRAAVGERTASIADDHLKRFSRLNRKYGMRLPSIADRLGERFVRPLAVDRLCASSNRRWTRRPAGRNRQICPRARRQASPDWRRASRSSRAKSPAPVSMFPHGLKRWSRRSIAPWPTARRKRNCPIPNCPSSRSGFRARRCGGRCRRWAGAGEKGL